MLNVTSICCKMPVLDLGAIAQLVERNTGSVEVSGSIPLGSTKKKKLIKISSPHRLAA